MTILYMLLAIAFETGWAVAMKASIGLSRPVPAAITIVCYLLSVVFLALAAKRMELGAAYAIWAGSGAVLIALAGAAVFGEALSPGRVLSIGLIVAGIVGIHLSGSPPPAAQTGRQSASLADSG
ncbi:MAG: multidrug efflux SMR transporter [Phycisphaerales bacterium]|nr:multidrug efflux SMR transporter [Phycisphaerales bacterium]